MIKTCNYIAIVLLLCVTCMSCNSDKPKKPNSLIPKSKMSNILYDLYIINAAKGVNRKLMEEKNIIPEVYILDKYNVDSTQFANSNNYYAFYTEAYKTIIEAVKARLENEKTKYDAILKVDDSIKKQKRDSIKTMQKKNNTNYQLKITVKENDDFFLYAKDKNKA